MSVLRNMQLSVSLSALLLFAVVPSTTQAGLRSPVAGARHLRPYQDGDVISDRLPTLLREDRKGHSKRWNLFGREPAQSKLETPVGVVCRTLLHPQLRERYVKEFLAGFLDQATADELDAEVEDECRKLFELNVWPQLFSGYTGSWPQNPPFDAESAVLVPVAEWMNAKRSASLGPPGSWNDVTKGGNANAGSNTAARIKAVRDRTSDRSTPPLHRLLDFGCGDGLDLSGAASHLGLNAADALGLDVDDRRNDETRDGFTFLHADLDNYDDSLQSLRAGVAGTVSFAWSFVVFHHIPENHRVAAISFIRDSLVQDGMFLLAEWDNPVLTGPLDFTVYFDLQHILPVLLLGNPAPTDQQVWIDYVQPLGTEYLSAGGWIDTVSANGLAHDTQRSLVPDNNATTGVTSWKDTAWMVENWPQRNFQAVFSKV